MQIKSKKITWVDEDEPPSDGSLVIIFDNDPDDEDAKLEGDPPTCLNLISSNA